MQLVRSNESKKDENQKYEKFSNCRQKLQTDEELNWVDHGKTLREQGILEEETLLLR